MRSNAKRALIPGIAGAVVAAGVYAEIARSAEKEPQKNDPVSVAVDKGVRWLVSVQGNNGGWGQDGGETSYVRQGERLESNGNDVANTAVASEALLHTGSTPVSGPYRQPLSRAVDFILQRVEKSPAEGLTDPMGTQIQRKLGPYIDTFLTAKLLAEVDGGMGSAQANARVHHSLEKCVAKIEKGQLKDGSWNIAGGWAPIIGTSMASQSLSMAQRKGVPVQPTALAMVETYTRNTSAGGRGPMGGRVTDRADSYDAGTLIAPGGPAGGVAGGAAGGVLGGIASGAPRAAEPAASASAGVSLYKRAQELEQLSRDAETRQKNAKQIDTIKSQLSDTRFVTGFGSIGGEEFFSYLNISDSLHRAGGAEWNKWNADMKAKILKMQNEDGTWAGHHCITGRVAVTSAAILTLMVDREPALVQTTSAQARGARSK